jgi:hypothetical protein
VRVSGISYLVLKNFFKKYDANIGKCEDIIIRKIMVQFKFNLDAQFNIYSFSNFNVTKAVFFYIYRIFSL